MPYCVGIGKCERELFGVGDTIDTDRFCPDVHIAARWKDTGRRRASYEM